MSNKQSSSNRFDFQLEHGESGVIARRATGFLADGAYLFQDELEMKGELTAKVITCAAWLFELYELKTGELFFLRDDAQIRPKTKCFGVFYPPFTISQPSFKNVKARLVGVAATDALPSGFTTIPVVFETIFTESPSGLKEVIQIVDSGHNRQGVEFNSKPSLLSLRAKRLIDENYLIYPSIARLAARLGVTHEHLSRQFKRDFRMSPSAYLHQVRLADATLRLAKNEKIVNVSQDVGYNDLSRFYKQFRKTNKTSPGLCQTMVKPTQP